MTAALNECARCGTCCRKGGPALHREDLPLVREGSIPLHRLYTLRAGERVRDNVNGGLIRLASDIIKIHSLKDSAACVFYDAENDGCAIYRARPLECRAMSCRDTARITEVYARDRVERRDLFGHIAWLIDLIKEHEIRCSYMRISEVNDKRMRGESAAAAELSAMIAYDESLRSLVGEKDKKIGRIVDLLFGRPLRRTLPDLFGIRIGPI